MKAWLLSVFGSILVTTSCATGPGVGTSSRSLRIQPEQAVMNAAAVAPNGVNGIFEMLVRATGRQGGNLYINSELDYRDPRNLSIAVPGPVATALAARFGTPPDQFLIGKTIAIRGTARRVRIDFTTNGRPTGKYYYQTHVRLEAPHHLTVEGEMPRATR